MVLKFFLMHNSYHQPPSKFLFFFLWSLLVPPFLFLSLMVLHHQYFLLFLPRIRFLVLELKLKVHTEMMVWPFPSKISYVCKASHCPHTFYRPFQYIFGLYPTLNLTIDMHLFLSLSMPWIWPKANYVVY
jgi:hypothetical protein